MTTLVRVTNPFDPMRGRIISVVPAGTIREILIDNDVQFDSVPVVCLRNGEAVLRSEWDSVVGEGDTITSIILPQGGEGSNPAQAVLMIALLATANPAATALTGATEGGMFLAAKFAYVAAGSMLVNSLIPVNRPPQLSDSSGRDSSPTYSLSAQGNRARLGQPIPVLYGRHILYPDFAAEPYTEYEDDDLYLYELLCVGQGEFDIESIRFDDTSFVERVDVLGTWELHLNGEIPGIEFEVIPPGGTVTLFPSLVSVADEVSSNELLAPNEEGHDYIGGFAASPSGITTNKLAVDVITPTGLFHTSNEGRLENRSITFVVEAMEIDNSGNSLGPWNQIGEHTLTAASIKPLRKTFRYNVSRARYSVRVKRTSNKDTSMSSQNSLVWENLRGYRPDDNVYPGVTMLALRMKASNALSGRSTTQVNLIATRKLQSWDPVGFWSNEKLATRSIAWAIADVARASYGVGLADTRVDLQKLYELDQIWTARGDHFDGIYDQKMDAWSAITQIARAGRARPVMLGGVISFVRDEPSSVVTAMFTPRNIVRGSFSVEYLFPGTDTPDCIVAEYIDKNTWKPAEVRAVLPGKSGNKEFNQKFFGFIERDHVYREAMYALGDANYRRRRVRFTTELEGHIPVLGDLVSVSHDMPAWGQSGDVVEFETQEVETDPGVFVTRNWITVDQDLELGEGNHYVALRKRDGSMSGPWLVNSYSSGVIEFDGNIGFTPYTGLNEERTHFSFGWGDTYAMLARILDIKPRGTDRVEILVVGENEAVHTVENGVVPPPVSPSQLGNVTGKPNVTGLKVVQRGTLLRPIVVASWKATPGADHYLVELSYDGSHFTRIADTESTNISFYAAIGYAWVRVAAVGLVAGNWQTWAGEITGDVTAPSAVTGFISEIWEYNILLKWNNVVDNGAIAYEVRRGGTSWSDATVLVESASGTTYTYRGLPAGSNTFRIKAKDENGNYGPETTTTLNIVAPQAPAITAQVIDNNVLLKFSSEPGTLAIAEYEIRKGDVFFSAEVIGSVGGGFQSVFETAAGEYRYWAVAIDRAGNMGSPSSVVAKVGQPPDYVLNVNWKSEFTGTKSNVIVENIATGVKQMVMPFDTTELYGDHFTSRSWTSPADQVAAGFPRYAMPAELSGWYEEEFDYGTVLAGSLVSVILNRTTVSGVVTFSVDISVKKESLDAWTQYTGVEQIYVTNFRYVKVRITAVAANTASLAVVGQMNVKLDSKLRTDAGKGTAVLGKAVQFNGTTGYGKVVSSATTNPGGPFTVVLDFEATDSSNKPIVEWNNGVNVGFSLIQNSTKNDLRVILRAADGAITTLTATSVLIPLRRYRVVVRYDGANVTIFLDGRQIINGSCAAPDMSSDIYFAYRAGQSLFSSTSIDNFRLFARAVTDDEMLEMSKDVFKNLTAERVRLLFDEGIGSTIADGTGNGNTCTLYGGYTWIDDFGTIQAFRENFVDVTALTPSAPYNGSPVLALVDFIDDPYPVIFRELLFNMLTGARVSGPFTWSARGY